MRWRPWRRRRGLQRSAVSDRSPVPACSGPAPASAFVGHGLEAPQPLAGLVVGVVVGGIADHDFSDRGPFEGGLEEGIEQPYLLAGGEIAVALLQLVDGAGENDLKAIHRGVEGMDLADLF